MRIRLENAKPERKQRLVLLALCCGLLLALAISLPVQAQQYSGTVTGTVSDASGGGIPGATVTIINRGTNATNTAKTNDQGAFTFAQLPVGTYDLHVKQGNFKEFISEGVEVHVSSTTTVNASLQVGTVSETVTVQASNVEVQTTTAVIGEVIQGTQVRELPLNGENFVGLTQLSPGVSPANSFDGRDKGLAGGVDFSVNGNPYTNNLFLVDGVNNNDVGSGRTILVYPSVDAISEFKMIRNSYGPEYGQASGAIISITTRSGENQWHGGTFFAGRNDKLNANDWFSNKNGTGKAELRRNDWGYYVAGPVVKDKLFFWWNQEWNREIRGASEAACVPTLAERSGDFSQGVHCGASAPVIPVAFQAPGNPLKIANPDAVGLLYGQFYPAPNVTGASLTGNNWAQSIPNKLNWSEWNVRADYDLTKKNRVTFRWTNDSWTNPAPNPGTFWGDSIFPTVGANWSQPSKSVMAKLTTTLSDSMVNDLEFGYGHNAIITTLGGSNPGLVAQINAAFPTSWPASLKQKGALPETGWGGLQPYGSSQTIWNIAPYQNHEDLYTVQDNLSKVRGNHVFKVGAFYGTNAKIEDNNGGTDQPTLNAGDGSVVVAAGAAGARTGNQLANILIPGTGANPQKFVLSENSINATAFVNWHDFEWYLGDSWKIRRNITVEYGFRWSFYREPFGQDNHWASFSLAAYNPALPASDACNGVIIVPGTTPCADATKSLAALGINLPLSAGTPGPNRALVNQNNHDIAPRLGIAWDVMGDGKTAVRVGVGQFFQREIVGIDEGLARTAPFVINATANRPLDTAAPLTNPQVSPNAAKDPAGLTPNSWQWNLSVERQLARNTALEVGYVGNAGIHLTSMADLNAILPANYLQGSFLSGGAQNALRPAGNFGTIGEFARAGHSNYHSLQALFRSQLGNYSTFQASYTWSHSIGDVENDNSSGSVNQEAVTALGVPGIDKGNTNINRPNIFVANEVFFLPKLASHGMFVQQSLGGWELNSIVTLENGTSFTPFTNGANATLGSSLNSLIGTGFPNSQRPNSVAGVSCNSGAGIGGAQIWNPAAFTLVGDHLGTVSPTMASRGSCYGPGTKNFDVQFGKSWYFKERFRLKFSLDMFNIFNHANFTANGFANGYSGSNLSCGAVACSPANNVVTSQAAGSLGNFGQATQVRPGREMQYGLKFTF